jgi:hypothetical protein
MQSKFEKGYPFFAKVVNNYAKYEKNPIQINVPDL